MITIMMIAVYNLAGDGNQMEIQIMFMANCPSNGLEPAPSSDGHYEYRRGSTNQKHRAVELSCVKLQRTEKECRSLGL